MLHQDTRIFWDRGQAEQRLHERADTWSSWSGGSEQAARLTWVNEVQEGCTVQAKTTGKGAETRRRWV